MDSPGKIADIGSMTDRNDQPRPDLPPSDLPRPDLAGPDGARPDVARPDVPRPDVPRPDVPGPDLRAAVALGRLAPSVHNTQPWRFQISGPVLDLHADLARRLDVLDPDGRQLAISCGAAVFYARLALRLQGFDTTIEVFDGFADPSNDLLARLTPTRGAPATDAERAMADQAPVRHTQRGPFRDEPVAAGTLSAVRAAAETEGAWIRVLTETSEQIALAVLLNRAEDAESADEAYRTELATWTHRPGGAADGLPAAALPDHVRARHSTVRLRDFALEGERGSHPVDQSEEAPAAERPVVAVIGTVDDEVGDWVLAGQAMAHVLLRAAVDGVQASPLGQVVDVPWARQRLGVELGTVGHPQMVLRLGYGTPGPASPRRDLGDVLG